MNPEQIQTAIAEMSFERGETQTLRRVALALAASNLGERFDANLKARVADASASELDALVSSMIARIASSDPDEILALFDSVFSVNGSTGEAE